VRCARPLSWTPTRRCKASCSLLRGGEVLSRLAVAWKERLFEARLRSLRQAPVEKLRSHLAATDMVEKIGILSLIRFEEPLAGGLEINEAAV
jgi:hypothetical protein